VNKKVNMAKNKSQRHGDVDEYLTHVEWQNQQSQRQPYTPLPWYMEPKWKFKRVVSNGKKALAKKTSIPVKFFSCDDCALHRVFSL
jgi:hypothetical protein